MRQNATANSTTRSIRLIKAMRITLSASGFDVRAKSKKSSETQSKKSKRLNAPHLIGKMPSARYWPTIRQYPQIS